jgi:hypothetical protein
MKLFKILTRQKFGKDFVIAWQVMESVPPISQSQQINPGFWKYNEAQYILDMDYTPNPIDEKDIFMIYKKQLYKMLVAERLI